MGQSTSDTKPVRGNRSLGTGYTKDIRQAASEPGTGNTRNMKCVTQGARDMGHETSNNGIDAVERRYGIYI